MPLSNIEHLRLRILTQRGKLEEYSKENHQNFRKSLRKRQDDSHSGYNKNTQQEQEQVQELEQELEEEEEETFSSSSDADEPEIGILNQFEINQKKKESQERFKYSWNAIIEKYSQYKEDDERVDILDISTGEIVEDNGHLSSLADKRNKDIWHEEFNDTRERTYRKRQEQKELSKLKKNNTKQKTKVDSPKKSINVYEDNMLILSSVSSPSSLPQSRLSSPSLTPTARKHNKATTSPQSKPSLILGEVSLIPQTELVANDAYVTSDIMSFTAQSAKSSTIRNLEDTTSVGTPSRSSTLKQLLARRQRVLEEGNNEFQASIDTLPSMKDQHKLDNDVDVLHQRNLTIQRKPSSSIVIAPSKVLVQLQELDEEESKSKKLLNSVTLKDLVRKIEQVRISSEFNKNQRIPISKKKKKNLRSYQTAAPSKKIIVSPKSEISPQRHRQYRKNSDLLEILSSMPPHMAKLLSINMAPPGSKVDEVSQALVSLSANAGRLRKSASSYSTGDDRLTGSKVNRRDFGIPKKFFTSQDVVSTAKRTHNKGEIENKQKILQNPGQGYGKDKNRESKSSNIALRENEIVDLEMDKNEDIKTRGKMNNTESLVKIPSSSGKEDNSQIKVSMPAPTSSLWLLLQGKDEEENAKKQSTPNLENQSNGTKAELRETVEELSPSLEEIPDTETEEKFFSAHEIADSKSKNISRFGKRYNQVYKKHSKKNPIISDNEDEAQTTSMEFQASKKLPSPKLKMVDNTDLRQMIKQLSKKNPETSLIESSSPIKLKLSPFNNSDKKRLLSSTTTSSSSSSSSSSIIATTPSRKRHSPSKAYNGNYSLLEELSCLEDNV
ncbi:hypothetical protein PACTADRAFT_51557 [Pachysolen tannophilus NRRL Y-2460]|uniref:Uncharacterized protein n=1 Tax=Pachysolen tannophilus NRRL Y-2460 TaxID=669874 RepID=A0A1E4TQ53_PACTA|nr:hypothetical protein PACTADRAFT_51557 [Pachysolen tannophilus NRRL Y-2460]